MFLNRKRSATARARTIETNGQALDAMLLDAEIEHSRGDVAHAKRRCRQAWHPRPTRNGNPDFGWKLRSDVVNSEGRDQADHRARDGGGGNRQVVVLRRPRAGR